MPWYKQSGAFQRRADVNHQLRLPFARGDGELPLVKARKSAILGPEPSEFGQCRLKRPRTTANIPVFYKREGDIPGNFRGTKQSLNPRRNTHMKAHHVMLLVTFGAFVMVGGQRATAGGSGNTPLPTGKFSTNVTGSFAICVDPKTFANEPCSNTGVLAVPYSFTATGDTTRDKTGGCHTRTHVVTPLPPSALPPIVDSKDHISFKITDYDPTTGLGDLSFIGYDGGQCIGATFDRTGATVTTSGTEHFAVSQSGTRIDAIVTSLTGAANSFQYGSWIFNGVDLKQ